MFLQRKIKLSFYLMFALAIILMFIGEILIYAIYQLRWSSIRCRSANCTSILFVADPQMLGETFNTRFLSGIAIYDSDRDLTKTFERALAHAKPDVVYFLGDLLDEGSIASDDAYQRYLDRFSNVFKTHDGVQKIYIPGDNDIGGEGFDYVTTFKRGRFRQGFNETSSVILNNRLQFLNVNLLAHVYPEMNQTEEFSSVTFITLNIVLTHISLISNSAVNTKMILDRFKPSIIFSAHSHYSRVLKYPSRSSEDLIDTRIVTVDLNNFGADETNRNITEIMVPSSSYRMGVYRYGHGHALIANCTSILLVADAQLLGETFDISFYSGIAIYDSDNYLKRSFARAFAYTKPDVVCFLGDLLDEGSIASDDAYQRYLKRFNRVFKTGANVQKIHIPGDNDIGGDRHDYVTAFKTNRFHKSFNETSTVIVSNRLRFLNINLLTHIYPDLNETTTSTKLTNIVLSHISVLSYPGLTMKTIMDQFKPNIIFSGHSHYSRIITYPPAKTVQLIDNHIVKVDLNNFNAVENYRNFTEIMAPSSSYRMGVSKIGYGYAIIDQNTLYYTVLWSPNRFVCLWAYVAWLVFMLLILLKWIGARNCTICHSRTTYRFRHRLMIATDKF